MFLKFWVWVRMKWLEVWKFLIVRCIFLAVVGDMLNLLVWMKRLWICLFVLVCFSVWIIFIIESGLVKVKGELDGLFRWLVCRFSLRIMLFVGRVILFFVLLSVEVNNLNIMKVNRMIVSIDLIIMLKIELKKVI